MNKKDLKNLKAKKVRDLNLEELSWPSRKRFKTLLFMGLGLLTLIGAIGIFNKDGVLEVLESAKEVQMQEANIFRLKAENQKLIREIDSLNNDPRYLEKVAREDLGLALPGETIFVFPDS